MASKQQQSLKAAGDDGIPADWYKTVGARKMDVVGDLASVRGWMEAGWRSGGGTE